MESNDKMNLVARVLSGEVDAILDYVTQVIAGEIDETRFLDKHKLLEYAARQGSDKAAYLLSILSSSPEKTETNIEQDDNIEDDIFTSDEVGTYLALEDTEENDIEINNISVSEAEKCMLEARDLYREYLNGNAKLCEHEKAISLMEKAIELDVENRLPKSYKKEFIVILYEFYREKNYQKASCFLELGVSLEIHVLMYEKGNILCKKGNFDEAIEMYKRAMEGDDVVRIPSCRALIQIILFEKGCFNKNEHLLQQGIVNCLEFDNEDIYTILIFADYLFKVKNNKDKKIGWMFNRLGIQISSNINKIIFSLYKKALDLSIKLPSDAIERQLGKLAYQGMAKISSDYTKKMYYEQKALTFK